VAGDLSTFLLPATHPATKSVSQQGKTNLNGGARSQQQAGNAAK